MRVLVTGGRGYVGGRVCEALSAQHDVVIGVHRSDAPTEGRTDVRRLDVTDAAQTDRVVREIGPTAIVHLAALNEHDSLRDPRRAWEVNCEGTLNLIDSAVAVGVQRFIYVSTFHVYGKTTGHISEDTATAPAHPYAATHRAAEDLVRGAARYQRLPGCSLRLSNAFGVPHDASVSRWTLVFNDLCRQAVTTGQIVLATAGGQHRDFITLHDVGRAIAHALQADALVADGAAFNLGGRCSMSIRHVAELVARLAERELGHPIAVRAPAGPLTGKSVDYDIGRLEASGFRLEGNVEREVVDTIRLCERAVQEGRWPMSASAS